MQKQKNGIANPKIGDMVRIQETSPKGIQYWEDGVVVAIKLQNNENMYLVFSNRALQAKVGDDGTWGGIITQGSPTGAPYGHRMFSEDSILGVSEKEGLLEKAKVDTIAYFANSIPEIRREMWNLSMELERQGTDLARISKGTEQRVAFIRDYKKIIKEEIDALKFRIGVLDKEEKELAPE